jgi:hypothetical protein
LVAQGAVTKIVTVEGLAVGCFYYSDMRSETHTHKQTVVDSHGFLFLKLFIHGFL